MLNMPQTQLSREITAQEIVESAASLIGGKRYAESAERLLERLHRVEDAEGKLAGVKEDLEKIKDLKERIGAL